MPRNARQTIADTACRLFHAHGFAAVSVDKICREAAVSRPTFYKYYADKAALVQAVVIEQKNRVRAALEDALARQETPEGIAETFFRLQRESFAELYSPAFSRDIAETADLALERFFTALNEEKHAFMRGFFATLQQRGMIRADIPVELVGLFLRQTDTLMQQPELAAPYAGDTQRLQRDILSLLLHGLAGGGQGKEAV